MILGMWLKVRWKFSWRIKHLSRKHIILCLNHSTWKSNITLNAFWIRVGSQNQHESVLHQFLQFKRKMEVFHWTAITGLWIQKHKLTAIHSHVYRMWLIVWKEKITSQSTINRKFITKLILMQKAALWLPSLTNGTYMNGSGSYLDWQMRQLSSRDLWEIHFLACEMNLLFHTLMTPWYFPIHLMTTWTI